MSALASDAARRTIGIAMEKESTRGDVDELPNVAAT